MTDIFYLFLPILMQMGSNSPTNIKKDTQLILGVSI